MAKAEILTIGTEILLGEIVDTNSSHIARKLRDHGIDIYWLSTVGDNPERIAEAIRQGMKRSEIIISTGGLGPTIDDPTREAAAMAFGVHNEFRPELWQQVQERFARFGRTPTENNKRQAFVPQGAIAIRNPVGTAPAFILETDQNAFIALPGVPREMEHLLEHAVIPYLQERFGLQGLIKTRILRTAGAGESAIDQQIADMETLSNPTVGLSAHAGAVDIRITAKAETETLADQMIQPVETELRQRLGKWIYGADSETLEEIALAHLHRLGWKLAVVESGLDGLLIQQLAKTGNPAFLGGEVGTAELSQAELQAACRTFNQSRQADLCIGVSLKRSEQQQDLLLEILSPIKQTTITHSYGGPPKMAAHWAVNIALDLIRRLKAD